MGRCLCWWIVSPRVFTSPVVRLVWREIFTNNVLQKFAAFAKIMKDQKYGKASKSNALSRCLCRLISLPILISSDLNASSAIYVWIFDFLCFSSVLRMRDYSLKWTVTLILIYVIYIPERTYSIPIFPQFYSTLWILYFITKKELK